MDFGETCPHEGHQPAGANRSVDVSAGGPRTRRALRTEVRTPERGRFMESLDAKLRGRHWSHELQSLT